MFAYCQQGTAFLRARKVIYNELELKYNYVWKIEKLHRILIMNQDAPKYFCNYTTMMSMGA